MGNFRAGSTILMQRPDFLTVVGQKVFTAGEIERAFLIETGHTGVANRIDIIRKILVYVKLHEASAAHCT
jgi:hypothetical protein